MNDELTGQIRRRGFRMMNKYIEMGEGMDSSQEIERLCYDKAAVCALQLAQLLGERDE